MSRVVVAGHICVDLAPHADRLSVDPGQLIEVGPLSVHLGGCVANTGRALADLGHAVEISARVGADDLGDIAKAHLAASPGVLGTPTVTPDFATSYSVVLEPVGRDRSFWHHVGANAAFDGSEVDVTRASLVHLGYPSLLPRLVANNGSAFRAFIARARDAGVTTSLDLAVVDAQTSTTALEWEQILRRSMPGVDVISPSADDLRSALGQPDATAQDLVDLLLTWGVAVAVVSDGVRGISVGTAKRDRLRDAGQALHALASEWCDMRFHEPAQKLSRVSTTNGAGDAATAGFLSSILRGEPVRAAAARAIETAAAVIQDESLYRMAVKGPPRTIERTQ